MTKFICLGCDYVYQGEELPEDFRCPFCGAGPEVFQENIE